MKDREFVADEYYPYVFSPDDDAIVSATKELL